MEQGFRMLGIISESDKQIVFDSLIETEEQRQWQEKIRLRREFEDRFSIPVNQTKSFYKELEKRTKIKIQELKIHMRTCTDCWVPEDEQSRYIEKLNKLRAVSNTDARGMADVTGAKKFPIDQLIEFRGGMAKCIFHGERTASMKYNRGTNTVYCFSCNQKWDAIDVYMKINAVQFGEAIKRLT